MEVELAWMGHLNGAVEGQLLFKERSISGAGRSGSRKAMSAEDTRHLSKLCVKIFSTYESFIS